MSLSRRKLPSLLLSLPALVGARRATDGPAMARAFVSDLKLGLNIERAGPIQNGWITAAQLREYKDLGITHMRFFPPVRPDWGGFPDPARGGIDYLLDAAERAMAVGLKVHVDLLDIMSPSGMADRRVMPYLRAAAQRVGRRNWEVSRYALGAVNEYAGGTNAEHRAKMHEATAVLRAELPDTLLVVAGGYWGHPDHLMDGTFVPPRDGRILVQWHCYDPNAADVRAGQHWQDRLSAWAAANDLVTYCGEWGVGPPDNSTGAASNQAEFPKHIDAAARGMGQQRPTFWTVTTGGWWRFNQDNSGALRPDVAAAIAAGSRHIDRQPWFRAAAPGRQVRRIQVLHRGQSNAAFAAQYGADAALRDTLAALTALPVDLVSRVNSADDSTLHSGSYSYWDSPYNGDPRWLAPRGDNYASAPAGWRNQEAMTQTLNAVSRHVSADPEIPLIDLRLHWEYDLAMEDEAARAAYRAGTWEITRRIRAARPKAAGKHVAAYAYCPYEGGHWHALGHINAAWAADLDDAARSVVMACGNMMDAEKNTQYAREGDPSHWGGQSAPRIYPRIAFRLAKLCWDNGWLPADVDLSDCPSMGPRIRSASRSGNSVHLVVAHDKGSSLVAGQDGIDWSAFAASNGDGSNHLGATGGAITGADTVRVDFPARPAAGGRVWYAAWPNFRRKRLIRDNWHAARPAKYAAVPNVGVVEFPLQRTLAGVPY